MFKTIINNNRKSVELISFKLLTTVIFLIHELQLNQMKKLRFEFEKKITIYIF